MTPGEWVWNEEHRQVCQLIETQRLWGETICRVWLPTQEAVVNLTAACLKPVAEAAPAISGHHLAYIAAAARIADTLTRDVLLAPVESSVIPLPHQLRALSRAISHDRVRYLLADEVGLGKTVEAGLIMRELKLRGLVRRTLVVAPKGLVTQWVSEMQTHFDEEFRLLIPGDFSVYRRFAGEENLWRTCNQVVCPLDSVKPLESRRGWSNEQVADYNRERYEGLVSAGWDLVVIDEAHRLGGSTDQVARYKLGQGLAEASPYLLLLSATPHQGKTDAFHRILSLLDRDAFPAGAELSRERVQSYVIRTEKRRAIDVEGRPLFKPRRTRLVPVRWEPRHREQRLLYDAITEYAREGYNQALREKKSYVGFLMLLMQRLVTSSTRAIRATLERRLEVLQAPEEQLSLFPTFSEDDWADLDGQEQIEVLLRSRLKALRNERAEVELLLEAAKHTEAAGVDAKAEALLDWIYLLQQEETDSDMKVLVFTEFVPTQEMLRQFLSERSLSVVCLNGSMGMDERRQVQETFAREARVLVSTDAGGEGLNLQFCHVVVNYDIPWNPMRLEQRIGRVDRIGQRHTVRAVNLVLENTVEFRVRQVLEEKLGVILAEFGVDKTSDVLDSVQAGEMFDELFAESLIDPANVEAKVETMVSQVHDQARASAAAAAVLCADEELSVEEARRVADHPLPLWVESMTVNYLKAHGGGAEKRGPMWVLRWPHSEWAGEAFFTLQDANDAFGARHLTLEDSRVRGLVLRLPPFAPGQPVARLELRSLPSGISGFWSLWRISLRTEDWNRHRIMPIFLHDDGRVLLPTARGIWEHTMSGDFELVEQLTGERAEKAYAESWKAAERYGHPVFSEIAGAHRKWLEREREKGEYSFAARRRVIARLGLPAVRTHREAQLLEEERGWREQLKRRQSFNPEMSALLLVRIGS